MIFDAMQAFVEIFIERGIQSVAEDFVVRVVLPSKPKQQWS